MTFSNHRWIGVVGLLVAAGCTSGPFATRPSAPTGPDPARPANISPAPLTSNEPYVAPTDESRLDVLLATARTMESSQQVGEAITAYEKILSKEPNESRAWKRLAVLHDRSGRPDLAEPYYQQALQRHPRDATLHADYGYSLYLRERWADSEQHLRTALSLQPGSKRSHVNLGMLLARTERGDEALREFALGGLKEAEARNNLALAMSLNRRFGEAAEQYAQAVQLDPQLKQAAQSQRELRGVMAKLETGGSPTALAAPRGEVMPASYQTSPADLRREFSRFPPPELQ